MNKTLVMKILDSEKISYVPHFLEGIFANGIEVAAALNKTCEEVFKTLVTIANTLDYFVFVIPVNKTLNLKKAAKMANVKSVEMIKSKDLFSLTGYVHGGCSPIGMKKQFKTFIDCSAEQYNKIFCSAGKVGVQIEIAPHTLKSFINATFCDLC